MSWRAPLEQDYEFTVREHDHYWPECGRVEAHAHVFHTLAVITRHHCPARDEDPS